jgi:hypothetical protein
MGSHPFSMRPPNDEVPASVPLSLILGETSGFTSHRDRNGAHRNGCRSDCGWRGRMLRGPFRDFRDAVKKAEPEAQMGLLSRIEIAGREPKYWHANAWLLERKDPKTYGPPATRTEHLGPGGHRSSWPSPPCRTRSWIVASGISKTPSKRTKRDKQAVHLTEVALRMEPSLLRWSRAFRSEPRLPGRRTGRGGNQGLRLTPQWL